MSERSDLITRLLEERDFRSSYLRGKLNVLISAQLYSLRKNFFGTQKALSEAVSMKQSRISAMERPGFTKFNLETLIRLAATFKVGLMVKFIPYSEMLRWDNSTVQDDFNVLQIDKDIEFLTPSEELPSLHMLAEETLTKASPLRSEQTYGALLGRKPLHEPSAAEAASLTAYDFPPKKNKHESILDALTTGSP